METQLLSTTVPNRVYKESAIQVGTFLGGPLVAGYLIATNFKQLGEEEKVKKTWLWTIIGFITYIVIAVIVPDSVPAFAFNIVATVIIGVLVQQFQSTQIKAHIAAGGALYTTKRAALIGICVGLVFLALVLGFYFFVDTYMQ